jgi:hypothetical protein
VTFSSIGPGDEAFGVQVLREWYRVYGHPHGADDSPALYEDVDTGLVYPSAHPAEQPYLRVVGENVYSFDSEQPWFVVRGSCVYPTDAHPIRVSPAPWFQIR